MANVVASKQTSLSGDEVITKAVRYFSTEKWKATTQSARSATFEGKPRIPIFLLFCTFIGFLFFVVPGIIMYLFVIRKLNKFQNLVISTTPEHKGCHVEISYPNFARGLARSFLQSLPDVQ